MPDDTLSFSLPIVSPAAHDGLPTGQTAVTAAVIGCCRLPATRKQGGAGAEQRLCHDISGRARQGTSDAHRSSRTDIDDRNKFSSFFPSFVPCVRAFPRPPTTAHWSDPKNTASLEWHRTRSRSRAGPARCSKSPGRRCGGSHGRSRSASSIRARRRPRRCSRSAAARAAARMSRRRRSGRNRGWRGGGARARRRSRPSSRSGTRS